MAANLDDLPSLIENAIPLIVDHGPDIVAWL